MTATSQTASVQCRFPAQMRCPECQSADIRYVNFSGPTGVSFAGSEENWSDEGAECETCGVISDFAIAVPELDQLDELLTYHAEAPLGEPPAEYLPKRPPTSAQLTPREWQIARLVAEALTDRDIACELGIGEQNVKNILASVREKLQLPNRTAIALYVERQGVAA